MQTIEQALLSFFRRVARRDEAQLRALGQEPRFTLDQERWCFSLPDLHRFLQRQDTVFREVDYKAFRRVLYASPVNRAAKRFGAEITIADNRARVDESCYALRWRAGK